ncbi:MAG: hypothetical protein RJQ04_20815 [Longimicrobiales bacterium]
MERTTLGTRVTAALCLCYSVSTTSPREAASQVVGTELAAAVNLLDRDASLDGRLFVADDTPDVRCLMVVLQWGLGEVLYRSQDLRAALAGEGCGLLQLRITNIHTPSAGVAPSSQLVRNAGVAGSAGLALLLEELADDAARPGLTEVPLIFWGHSAAGTFGLTYAAMHPERTLGFIRYNSHLRGVPVELVDLDRVPGLLIAGELDRTAGVDDTLELWARGRAIDAPWTLAIQPDGPHGSPEFLERANALLIPWVTAVARARASSAGSETRVPTSAAWLGDPGTAEVWPSAQVTGSRSGLAWLPDEATAFGWQIVMRGGGAGPDPRYR